MKKNKNKKGDWINVPKEDIIHWLGQYMMASMVLSAWDEQLGRPDRVGRVGKLKSLKNGDATMTFEAQWDD